MNKEELQLQQPHLKLLNQINQQVLDRMKERVKIGEAAAKEGISVGNMRLILLMYRAFYDLGIDFSGLASAYYALIDVPLEPGERDIVEGALEDLEDILQRLEGDLHPILSKAYGCLSQM